MSAEDLELVRRMVQPLAAKAGLFAGRVMAMVTEDNLRAVFEAVGEDGIRAATEALVRIGRTRDASTTGGEP